MTIRSAFPAPPPPRSFAFFLVALIAGLAGCAHYQLGTAGKLSFATLCIAPVENKVLLPQAKTVLSTQIRDTFLRDGRVSLASSPEGADATLQVVVRDYSRSVEAARADDTGLARKFALTLTVTCTLRDNRSGKVLFADREVTVRRDAFTDGGQLQSEYQALPLLAQSLADKVAHTVLDVW
jgi:outer membrane lipopolysaccharide assembly protein LptE/RlpB